MLAHTIVPKETRRDAIMSLYLVDEEGDEAADRQRRAKLAATLAKKAGCTAGYLLDGCRRLKKGLEYNDKSWTLRRAANVVCGVDDDDRAYTNHELMTAVLLTQTPLVQLKLTQKAAQVRSPPPRVLSVAGGP